MENILSTICQGSHIMRRQTRLFLHAQDCSHNHGCIVVQSPDTIVAVLCIPTYHYLRSDQLWLRNGAKVVLPYLPIHFLVEKLGQELCKLLPALHAFKGFHITSGFCQTSERQAGKAFVNKKPYTRINRT